MVTDCHQSCPSLVGLLPAEPKRHPLAQKPMVPLSHSAPRGPVCWVSATSALVQCPLACLGTPWKE